MELKFKNSSMTCFQIVQLDQESKKYIMDTSTMSPKSYYWGFKTDTITVGMVEIEKNNNQFAINTQLPLQLLRKVMEEYILWLEQFSFVYFSFLV